MHLIALSKSGAIQINGGEFRGVAKKIARRLPDAVVKRALSIWVSIFCAF